MHPEFIRALTRNDAARELARAHYPFEWRVTDEGLKAVYIDPASGSEIWPTWAPQRGSQQAFLAAQNIFEVLYAGTRGPGKTDALLMDFAQSVGVGYGSEWRGILFRPTFPELADVINKSLKWFSQLFPGATYNRASHCWTFPGGELLYFRHFRTPDDYWKYHGHCVDEGEVLVEGSGWTPIQDVRAGQTVLSCDAKTKVVTYKKVLETHKYPSPGEMVRYSGRGAYQSFTERHNMVTAGGKVTPYNELPREALLMAGGWRWRGKALELVTLERQARKRPGLEDPNPKSLSGNLFCQFMGWYLSEGWTLSTGAAHTCGIAQSKLAARNEIREILRAIGLHFSETPTGFVWRSKTWHTYLSQFGKCRDKFVPPEVLGATVPQLRKFFEAYVSGDGTRQGDRSYVYTTSQKMADNLSEIALKLGMESWTTSKQRPNRKGLSWTVATSPRPVRKLYTDNRERKGRPLSKKTQVVREPHSGNVYCLTVEGTHTFFLRQRGSVWLSGNSYPWIAWEELCNWPDDKCYKVMRSCCRSTTPGIPRCYRATTNPYGVGHNWVKRRWQLPQSFGKIIRTMDDDGNPEPPRVAIQGRLRENLILLHADPDYLQRLKGAARNPSELAAWVDGSWEITAGGMFDDIWRAKTHVVSFPIAKIPKTWKMDRSFDWGSSKPFAVCWWAESNGEPLVYGGRSYGTVRGDLFLIKEWYGWNGNRNEGVKMLASAIARGILERENDWGLEGRVLPGPADSSIFDDENGNSIERDMRLAGVRWKAADKSPGSRKQGWQQVRKFLEGAIPTMSGIREVPGLFVLDSCEQVLETVPPLPRDDKDLDDVNTDAEDHLGDAIRYRVRKKTREIKQTTGTR